MAATVNVCDLETMNRASLVILWQDVFKQPAPKMLSQSFLRRFLAFEFQSRRHGGLTPQVRTVLERDPEQSPRPNGPRLKPGGRLLREWNGVTHVVDVTEDGFDWNGRTYRSLSAIARAMTGAHWSGPRFFGLNGKSSR